MKNFSIDRRRLRATKDQTDGNSSGREFGLFQNRRMKSRANRLRRPFWLPASSYYVFAVAVSAGCFFIVWDILNSGRGDAPWVTAGISASLLLCGAVVLRELILRRVRNRLLIQQRIIETRGDAYISRPGDSRDANKLTLEKNAAVLHEIKQKSHAARVLNKFSAAHREVFELCGEYIARNENELKSVNPGSPRLAPLLRGRTAAADYHRYHMLRWAEIEARSLTAAAGNRQKTDEKIEAGTNALKIIESALEFYPAEQSLVASQELLIDLVSSIKISDFTERAERAAFKGNHSRAITLYKDALFYLGRDNVRSPDREQAAIRINEAIERIRSITN